jgi:hypothetical protein
MHLIIRRFPVFFVGIALAGCGETQLEVVKPLRPQYEAFRKQLAEMAAMDPKSAVRPPAALNPKPVLKGNTVDSNTAVFKFEQLSDPRLGLKAVLPMDPHISDRVLTQIRTGTLADEHLTRKASKNLRKDLNQALQVRYIGAVKILGVKPAVALSTENFQGGSMNGVAMLFDRETMKVVFADAFQAQTDAEVPFSYREGQKPTAAGLQGWLDSNLTSNMKKAALKKFADGTGGVFTATP